MQSALSLALLELQESRPKKIKYKYLPLSKEAKKRYVAAHRDWQLRNTPNAVKDHGYIETKFPKLNSNGLTNFIINYISFAGFRATRISTTGRILNGKWIHGTTRKGTADISSTINGKSVMWEIKTGADKPSEFQLKEQQREEAAGGYYFFVHTPDEFFERLDYVLKLLVR